MTHRLLHKRPHCRGEVRGAWRDGGALEFPIVTMLFVLCNLGIGLLVSTVVRNQQQAMMGATFVFMIPMI